MRHHRIALFVAASAILGSLSLPASAAAPSAAPTVSVTRVATGGYRVTWSAVPGASAYRIYLETPDGEDEGDYGYLVVGTHMSPLATASGSARSYRTADMLTPETNTYSGSVKFGVAGTNSAGTGPMGSGRAGCAAGYYVAARGSGQNPTGTTAARAHNAQGLGDRGARVYEDARKRLGLSRSMFQANAVNYPAAPVDFSRWKQDLDRQNYKTSKDNGVIITMGQIANITGHCPSARLILFGYSQGGQAVGDAVQKVSAATRKKLLLVMLFADAGRNPNDKGIQYRPIRTSGHGIAGNRPYFTDLTDRLEVSTWCWSSDDVCSADSWPFTFHGTAYDCYEKWAAETIAARAKNKGWRPNASLIHPTCTMQT